MDSEHIERIKKELKAVGVTNYGLTKSEVKHLPAHIHPDEHIHGAVYGKYDEGWTAFLIATDKRLIFYDRKPLLSAFDEIAYDAISGVKGSHTGLTRSITLHTRIGDYQLRFVNPKCAQIFTKYIEERRLEGWRPGNKQPANPTPYTTAKQSHEPPTEDAVEFLKTHDLGVFSTIDRTGNVHGAVVYYVLDNANNLYIQTKSNTAKGRNVFAHSQVAFTIFDAAKQQTLQISGSASIETDRAVKNKVFKKIVRPRTYNGTSSLPPVTKIHDGSFVVIKITPTEIKYIDYSKRV
jgi:general stress protein 26